VHAHVWCSFKLCRLPLAKRRDCPLRQVGSSSAEISTSPCHRHPVLPTSPHPIPYLTLISLTTSGFVSCSPNQQEGRGIPTTAVRATPRWQIVGGHPPAPSLEWHPQWTLAARHYGYMYLTMARADSLSLASPSWLVQYLHAHMLTPRSQTHTNPSTSQASPTPPATPFHPEPSTRSSTVKSGPHVSVMDMCGLRGSGCPASGEPQGEPNPGLCDIRLYGPS